MSELLESLAERISQPENKAKLTNFLGVVKDVVSSNAKVTVLETGNRFLLSQKDGIVQVTVSKDFLKNMGEFELGVHGSTPFTSNVHFNMSTPPKTVEPEKKNGQPVSFSKNGDSYKANVGNAFLDCLEDIKMVNMLKRPNLPASGFNMAKKYLEGQGFNVIVEGEVIDVTNEEVVEEPGTVVVQATPTSEPNIGEKIVIKEVPVYVDKVVIKEVPVEVQKVVIKEVPVYIEVENKKNVQEVKEYENTNKKTKGPIQEPEESKEEESKEEESEGEGDEEVVESSSSVQESEEEPEESPAESSSRKLKGRWLNSQKTILKSGDFVYRVDKKIDGPTELYALGRWDKDKQKRVALKKGDTKIIKALGNKISKK